VHAVFELIGDEAMRDGHAQARAATASPDEEGRLKEARAHFFQHATPEVLHSH
jgi:hypothetical protein